MFAHTPQIRTNVRPPSFIIMVSKNPHKKTPQKQPTSRGNVPKTNKCSPVETPRTPTPAPTPYKHPQNALRAKTLAHYNHCTLQTNKCSHLVAPSARNENDSHFHPPPTSGRRTVTSFWQKHCHNMGRYLCHTIIVADKYHGSHDARHTPERVGVGGCAYACVWDSDRLEPWHFRYLGGGLCPR